MAFQQPYPAEATIGRERVDSRAVFGQVMGLVAVTVAFAAAGAYIGRDLSSGGGWIAFIGAIGCIIGLNVAPPRHEQGAIALLFGLGLLLGIFPRPIFALFPRDESPLPLPARG